MARIFLWVIFLALLEAFQGSIINPFAIRGIRPDFILITVYLFGIVKGDIKGGLLGAVLGFIVDITSVGPVYYNIFSKSFIGYLAGIIGRSIQNPGYLLHTGLIFTMSLLQSGGILLMHTFLGMAEFPGDIIHIAIPQAIFDGVLGGVAYLLLVQWKREAVSRWAT